MPCMPEHQKSCENGCDDGEDGCDDDGECLKLEGPDNWLELYDMKISTMAYAVHEKDNTPIPMPGSTGHVEFVRVFLIILETSSDMLEVHFEKGRSREFPTHDMRIGWERVTARMERCRGIKYKSRRSRLLMEAWRDKRVGRDVATSTKCMSDVRKCEKARQ